MKVHQIAPEHGVFMRRLSFLVILFHGLGYLGWVMPLQVPTGFVATAHAQQIKYDPELTKRAQDCFAIREEEQRKLTEAWVQEVYEKTQGKVVLGLLKNPVNNLELTASNRINTVIEDLKYKSKEESTDLTFKVKGEAKGGGAYTTWDERHGWQWKTKVKQGTSSFLTLIPAGKRSSTEVMHDGDTVAVHETGDMYVACGLQVKATHDVAGGYYSKREVEAGLKAEFKVPLTNDGASIQGGANYNNSGFTPEDCRLRKVASNYSTLPVALKEGTYSLDSLHLACKMWADRIGDIARRQHLFNVLLAERLPVAVGECGANKACKDYEPTIRQGRLNSLGIVQPREPLARNINFPGMNFGGDPLSLGTSTKTEEERRLIRQGYEFRLARFLETHEMLTRGLIRACQLQEVNGELKTFCGEALDRGTTCFVKQPVKGYMSADVRDLKVNDARARYLGFAWDVPCRLGTDCYHGKCRDRSDIRKYLAEQIRGSVTDAAVGPATEKLKKNLDVLTSDPDDYSTAVTKIVDDLRDGSPFEAECRDSLLVRALAGESGHGDPKDPYLNEAAGDDEHVLKTRRAIHADRGRDPFAGIQGCDGRVRLLSQEVSRALRAKATDLSYEKGKSGYSIGGKYYDIETPRSLPNVSPWNAWSPRGISVKVIPRRRHSEGLIPW